MSILWDTRIKGLGVKNLKTKISFVFRKKGSTTAITIGNSSNMTLLEARKLAVSLGAKKMTQYTFEDLALEWGDNWGQSHRKRYKQEDLRRLNKYIFPAIGHLMATDIKGKDLILLHNRISIKGHVEANRCLALISAIYNKSLEWELISCPNPCRSVRRHSEQGRSRTANQDEITRLLAVLRDHPLGTIFLLCLCCGLRRGEASSIKWENVDLNNNKLILKKTKNGKDRVIFFTEEIKNRLKMEKSHQTWVFPSTVTGSHIKHLRRPWRQIQYEAKIEGLTIHDLRRTFATRLVEEGVKIEHVSAALGHSSVAVTQKYVHLSDQVRAQVFEKAREIFK